MHKILLHSPYRKIIMIGDFTFSNDIPFELAEALLCEWAPHDDILTFQGPKAWYHNEAVCRNFFDEPKWQQIKMEDEGKHFFTPSHPDYRYRIPMITHIGKLCNLDNESRIEKTIAVFSNTGLNFSDKSEINIRNQFVLHEKTDLYGRSENWLKYMKTIHHKDYLPTHFKEEIIGNWSSQDKLNIMSKYKVAICLENILEDHYFTEKFISAAQSGCIPIYHAHNTVKHGILSGAKWVDPADFDLDVNETIKFALSSDRKEYAKNNFDWLNRAEVLNTSLENVFLRMGDILTNQQR